VIAAADHNAPSLMFPRASSMQNRIRKNGEWKKPRWPKKLS